MSEYPVIALAGQPNCGKSTIFNGVASITVDTGNFSGTTVTFTETKILFNNKTFKLVDLPGTYSISANDITEKVTRNYLLSGKVDLIINVLDSSMLARSLEFTLQLQEMNIPMIVVFNMIDESWRKGMQIDVERFTKLTGLMAIPVVATRGEGIDQLFNCCFDIIDSYNSEPKATRPTSILPTYDLDVEECIKKISDNYPKEFSTRFNFYPRFVIIRLLEMDHNFEEEIKKTSPAFIDFVNKERQLLAEMHRWPEEEVMSSHRHVNVLNLYERIVTHTQISNIKFNIKDFIDNIITNPFGGIIAVVAPIFFMFYLSFEFGDFLAGVIGTPLTRATEWIGSYHFGNFFFLKFILLGLVQGLEAGLGIVIPYLLPLLFLLAIFEDIGLLPRIAFLVDGILHRFGLHGKAVLPIIMGYGCSVPAIMATRNFDNPVDRLILQLTIPFIACSARTAVILGLVGKYLGPWWITIVYLANILLTLLISLFLTKLKKDVSFGTIMDVPPLRIPNINTSLKKVWHRFYEFLILGWPVVIISSIILSILSLYKIDDFINSILSPITVHILHLPAAIGITLFLGVFRKELTILMLASALGTTDIISVLSKGQILTFTTFILLYIPCIASITTLWKEGGWKVALLSAIMGLIIAIIFAGGVSIFTMHLKIFSF